MNDKLEKKLLQYEKSAPISNDDELIKAIENIINSEESLPYEERDFDLVEEAIDTVLSLKGIDIRSLEECTDNLTDDYVCRMDAKKIKSIKKSTFKSIKLRWIIPVAALLSLLAITAGAYVFGYNLIDMTKEAIMQLVEKTSYKEGDHEFIITKDYKEYNSLSDYLKNEKTSNLLLPYDLPENCNIKNICVEEYGDYQAITLKLTISDEDFEHSLIIETPYIGENNLNQELQQEIGNYHVNYSQYDDKHQGEFIYNENHYIIVSSSYDNLKIIIESLRSK
ncbi:MAG: hypothetical protein HFE30_04050 [Clostridiales bacterium]|nr:hypothetical protein [Clostridiales bacterium]